MGNQNLPLFGVDGNHSEAVDINLEELGMTVGADWTQVFYNLSIDPSIRTMPPGVPTTQVTVGDINRYASDSIDEAPDPGPFTDPGRPVGIKIDGPVKKKTEDRVVTKVWDRGTDVDPITGVVEENGDFLTWLKKEIKTEDVEVAYFYPGNAHIVTITELYTKNGETWVKYRDDENQSNPENDPKPGDSGIKNAKIYQKNGQYHFGSDSNTIYFAVSESPKLIPTGYNTYWLILTSISSCLPQRDTLIGEIIRVLLYKEFAVHRPSSR
ncbi:MAG: hypothetical protein HY776_07115 [Actinobacteria bacterium]|nr:hypothetical protein [Actinomycetota bacterium]